MPLIAMTREMGSLGKDVATAVSARLGKPVVHHEIIDQLASKMRLRKSHVIRFLDGKANMWERLTTDKTSLSIYTADETLALAESGNVAVIRGWGSAHLLRPIQHVICVRVCAPMKVRVRRMMERLHTDDEEFVTGEIKLSEEAHGAITRRHFGINWQEPEQYDLVLNTERVSIEECADEVMALVNDAEFQETAQSTQLLANLALEAHVRAVLRADPRTAKMQIAISADKGAITLAGIVDRDLEPLHASEVAAAVAGVKDVKNQLKVAMTSRIKIDG
ncbi:MAG: cytidylate kinase family protein [Betaproteobacteria bacterium]|nr:cytidylate kinase family protein [Betaproteobacteria bacterium]